MLFLSIISTERTAKLNDMKSIKKFIKAYPIGITGFLILGDILLSPVQSDYVYLFFLLLYSFIGIVRNIEYSELYNQSSFFLLLTIIFSSLGKELMAIKSADYVYITLLVALSTQIIKTWVTRKGFK